MDPIVTEGVLDPGSDPRSPSFDDKSQHQTKPIRERTEFVYGAL